MSDESDVPLFTQRGIDFVPSEHTRGPWDPRHQHGGAVAALVARVRFSVLPRSALIRPGCVREMSPEMEEMPLAHGG